MIIGFAGSKGSGKSTAASFLEDRDWRLHSFATTLKLMVRVLMSDAGVGEEGIAHYQRDKEAIIPIFGVSYRHLCQTLGTEWCRTHVHGDVWVSVARAMLANSYGNVVFDDVRFENEASMIRDAGGLIVHVSRSASLSIDHHASESGLVVLPCDLHIYNDGSEDDLYDAVVELVAQ